MKQFILTHKVLCIVLACVLLAGVTCAIVLPIALKHEHAYATEWSNDATNHWHAATCEHTDLKKDEAAHDFGEGVTEGDVTTYTCKVCGFKKTETVTNPPHEHTYAEEWSHDETNHWHAATCGHDEKKDEAAHTFGEWTTKTEAGYGVNEVQKRTCTVCRKQEERTVANSALPAKDNGITVKTIDFTYNGKSQSIDSLVEAGNEEGMVVKYVGVDGTTYEESDTAPINAGTYQYTIAIPATAEWKEAEKTGKFTIAQYELKELYEIKTAEYDGTDRIWVRFKPFAVDKSVNIAIVMESANAGAKVSYVWLPGLIDDNYTYNQEKITATITPKKLSGLEIHIKESDIDPEQQEIRFTTTIDGVKINGENEKINVTLEFFLVDLKDNDDLLLTTERPEATGTENCKITINNANYELADSNIGRLYLDRETAES